MWASIFQLVLLAFRYLLFGKQIVEKGKIDDYTAGREYWTGLWNNLWLWTEIQKYTEWEDFQKNFAHILGQLEKQLKSFQNQSEFYSDQDIYENEQPTIKKRPRFLKTEPKLTTKSEKPNLSTLQYFQSGHSLQDLAFNFDLSICRHSKYENLIMLSPNPFSPNHEIVQVQIVICD